MRTQGSGTEVRLLRSLIVLAEEGHVGRAAARLHLTQPAVSKQLAQLERSTGLRLFDRHPRGLTLTGEGRLLVERARRVVHEADAFEVVAARTRRTVTGRLILGFVGQAANEGTPELLRAYHLAHPEVTVELRQYDMRDLTAGLISGASDLALLRLPVTAPDGSPALVHEPVLTEPRVAVLPIGHPLADRDLLKLADLFGQPWVVSANPNPAYQAFALETAARGRTPPLLGPTVASIDEYLEAVLAGHGIGLAPASAARYYARPGITYVPVADARSSVCALTWTGDTKPGPPARAMITIVRARRRPTPPDDVMPVPG